MNADSLFARRMLFQGTHLMAYGGRGQVQVARRCAKLIWRALASKALSQFSGGIP